MKNRVLVWSLISFILVFIICKYFVDLLEAIIISLSFILSVYYTKYFEYNVFRNSNYDVNFKYNKFGIPSLKYNNVKILRKIAASYIWVSKVFALSIMILISLFLGNILKVINELYWIYPLIGFVIGSLFHPKDIEKLFYIWFGKSDALYVQFFENKIEPIPITGVMNSHREVYFYEEIFKDYKKEDLKRELILVEQDINNMNRMGVWDKYLVPIILIFITSLHGTVNSIFIFDITANNVDLSKIINEYLIVLFFISLIALQVFIVKHYIITPPKSNLIVQKMVLNDLLNEA